MESIPCTHQPALSNWRLGFAWAAAPVGVKRTRVTCQLLSPAVPHGWDPENIPLAGRALYRSYLVLYPVAPLFRFMAISEVGQNLGLA